MTKIGDHQFISSKGNVFSTRSGAMLDDANASMNRFKQANESMDRFKRANDSMDASMKRLRDLQQSQGRHSGSSPWRIIAPLVVIIVIALIIASGHGPAAMQTINQVGRSLN